MHTLAAGFRAAEHRNFTFALGSECDKGDAVTILPLGAAYEFFLFNDESMPGGAGAAFFLAAGAAVAGTHRITLDEPKVRFLAEGGGASGVGILALGNQTARQEWRFTDGRVTFIDVPRGPGAYTIDLTWARGAFQDGITGGFLGIVPVSTLEEAFAPLTAASS